MKKIILISVVSLLTIQSYAANQIRSEVNRYRLMRDRQLIEKSLIQEDHNSFFSLDANISSGLKGLIGDVSDSSSEEAASDQVVGITEVLTQNINTERLLGIDLEFGLPLPYLKFENWAFLPTVFYALEIGASISINNQESVTSPEAKLYFQKTTKYGLHSKIKNRHKKDETWGISLYQRHRSDLSASRTATEISGGDGLIDLDELSENESIYALDLSFYKEREKSNYLLEVKGLKLMDAGGTTTTTIGNAPLVHGRYEKNYYFGNFVVHALFGAHYRQKYSVADAVYVGARFRAKEESPLLFIGKVDSQFLSYNMGLTFRHFHFHYGFKSPYRNPQEDMWVSSIHQISLNMPF